MRATSSCGPRTEWFLSLRAVHVPGILNIAADFLSRQKLRSGEWMLNRQTVTLIWEVFGKAEVDLFASQESTQCPLWFSLSPPAPLGIDAFAHPWPMRKLYAFPPIKLIQAVLVQSEGERSPPPSGSSILAIPAVVSRTDPSAGILPLGDSGQGRPAFPTSGQDMVSSPRHLEAVRLAYQRPLALGFDLPTDVQETIASARAPSTRRLYSSKWRVFKAWCLKPARYPRVPSWDLSVVLEGLTEAPFEPLESAPERILTLKVALLLALSSLKCIGDLQALSISESCLDFAPGLVKVTLRPRSGYVPKVLSTAFRSQVINLNAFHPPPFASDEDRKLNLLCPVRSLKLYVDRSGGWRKSNQRLVCFGAGRRGLAASKQRISHWVTDAISLAYEVRGLPSPLSIRAHSTRSVASSQAFFRRALLEDICVAAGSSLIVSLVLVLLVLIIAGLLFLFLCKKRQSRGGDSSSQTGPGKHEVVSHTGCDYEEIKDTHKQLPTNPSDSSDTVYATAQLPTSPSDSSYCVYATVEKGTGDFKRCITSDEDLNYAVVNFHKKSHCPDSVSFRNNQDYSEYAAVNHLSA
ncbi:unnamed protein product [Leuciscus chuanchicus]